jgi:hypothetical protein
MGSAFSYQLSAISYQLSAISFQLSAFSYQLFDALLRRRRKNVVAAGGRYISPPYPAANELSGIYRIKYARGVDSREVKSYVRSTRPLVSKLAFFAIRCFSNASERSSVGNPPLQ